jgi:hypothetical protein
MSALGQILNQQLTAGCGRVRLSAFQFSLAPDQERSKDSDRAQPEQKVGYSALLAVPYDCRE